MAKKHTQGRSPLAPDPHEAGSYYRRIQDIERALARMRVDEMPPVPQYIALYFGCEKLQGLIAAIAKRKKGRSGSIDVATAVHQLGLQFPAADLAWLFGESMDSVKRLASPAPSINRPARLVRNNLAHRLGPTHVEQVEQHAAFHTPKMKAFLRLVPGVLAYLDAHYSNL